MKNHQYVVESIKGQMTICIFAIDTDPFIIIINNKILVSDIYCFVVNLDALIFCDLLQGLLYKVVKDQS